LVPRRRRIAVPRILGLIRTRSQAGSPGYFVSNRSILHRAGLRSRPNEHDSSADPIELFYDLRLVGHLKYGHGWPLWKAIAVSWAIALFEYCLAVPANRLGCGEFSGFQLKLIQEVVTLIVFMVFAIAFLKEKLAWNYIVAFAFLGVAAFFAFAFKAPGPAA
jgi:hypothetical protein